MLPIRKRLAAAVKGVALKQLIVNDKSIDLVP